MRHYEGHDDFPSQDDLLSDPDLAPSGHGLDDPIDYEMLKAAIKELGPIQMARAEQRLKIILDISDCAICVEPCGNDVISLVYLAGATSLTTLINKSDFLESKSLNEFFNDFIHNPFAYFSASAECQYIERKIKLHLGFDPLDIFHGKVDPRDVKAELSKECQRDYWKAHTLQSIFRTLLLKRLEVGHFNRDDFVDEVHRRFEDSADFQHFLSRIYDLGFLTSRLISEHFIRDELEPFVKKGEAAEAAQERRNKGSGEAANKKRHLRVSSMLDQIEMLVGDNPVLRRLDIKTIADMAIEDAAEANPSLWSQGRGRRDDYIHEMRIDHRYRERFQKILGENRLRSLHLLPVFKSCFWPLPMILSDRIACSENHGCA